MADKNTQGVESEQTPAAPAKPADSKPVPAKAPTSKAAALRPADSKPVDYAFWEMAGSAFRVIYSLSLFHEIDFVVNEGYRKIPHGGIEEGGLLFGSVEENCIRIEAYRPITCDHVSGPSFILSEQDMANLEVQLMAADSDPELQKFKPVGWFLAHTRGPLSMTDIEVAQFGQLFPQPSRLTVLIKPERFQPTRFGFLVRDADRNIARDATPSAIILPLPGRSSKQGETLIPSIPAPAPSVTSRRRAESVEPADDPDEFEAPPPRRRTTSERPKPTVPADPVFQSIWKIPPEPDEPAADHAGTPQESRVPDRFIDPQEDPRFLIDPETAGEGDERTDSQRAARKQLARDRARVIEESLAVPGRAAPRMPESIPLAVPRPFPERTVSAEIYQQVEEFKAKSSEPILNSRSLSILAIAALLGCIVGYIGYLQLPAPVIAVEMRGRAQSVTVSWPPEETRDAIYASIRVDNGTPVALSTEEKNEGQVEISAAGDVKVEVMSRNWMRDSRGSVQYLRSGGGNANVLPGDSRRPFPR